MIINTPNYLSILKPVLWILKYITTRTNSRDIPHNDEVFQHLAAAQRDPLSCNLCIFHEPPFSCELSVLFWSISSFWGQVLLVHNRQEWSHRVVNLWGCGMDVQSQKVRAKEVYWNTLTFEYIRLHISMNKARMSKTHIYGNKLKCNCCNCWRYKIYPEREKHPVPVNT